MPRWPPGWQQVLRLQKGTLSGQQNAASGKGTVLLELRPPSPDADAANQLLNVFKQQGRNLNLSWHKNVSTQL